MRGQRFGRLTVIERRGSLHGASAWLCRCDCGNEIIATASNLKGATNSCGCYQKDRARETQTKHSMSHTKISYVWNSMKQRCYNPSNKGYKNYGGRGITVYKGWKENFQEFYNYVSKLPHFGQMGYSIDRIDNDGNYEPGNIRWATRTQQSRNRRNVNGTKS